MTVIELDTYRRPEPERNQHGQYLVPDAAGNVYGHQRVTTFVDLIKNYYSLTPWKVRTPVIGLLRRPELLAEFATLADPNDRDKAAADKIMEQAHDAGGGNEAARIGGVLHTFTELADRGEGYTTPAPWAADIVAYQKALADHGVIINPQWIERIVILDALRVAGTFDRIVTIDGEHHIADLKTGKDVASYPHDICLQLGLYANADALYNIETGQREPMPPVNKQRGLVIHLRPGTGHCDLYWFDITAGWNMVSTVTEVKKWRKKGGLVERLVLSPQQKLMLHAGMTKFPPLAPPPDAPTTFVVDEGDAVDPAPHLAKAEQGFARLGITEGSPQMFRWNQWLRDGDRTGRPFRFSDLPTRRRFRLYAVGARLLAASADDDQAFDLLVAAVGPHDHCAVGTYLGELTLDHATLILDALTRIDGGDLALHYSDDGTPQLTPTKGTTNGND